MTDAPRPSTSEPEPPADPRQAPEVTFAGGDDPRPWAEVPGPRSDDDAPPLLDPYFHPPPPSTAISDTTTLARNAVRVLLLGPVGAILGIVFGWDALQRIEREGGRRSDRVAAILAMALGGLLTMVWGGALSYLAWTHFYRAEPVAAAAPPPVVPPEPFAAPRTPPPRPRPADPVPSSPQHTKLQREGQITVVDVGVETPSLKEELARQRADASAEGETVLVMTTAADCAPCRGLDSSLRDPLMQSALAHVRLVRVDLYVFHEDLDTLKIPHERFPGFFLLAPDLLPRDGIDGGEWGDDIAANIAPVLGPFLRGKYTQRKEPWKPVTGSGVAL